MNDGSEFRRAPRQRKWLWSYVGHGVQGLLCGLVSPLPLLGIILAWYYLQYQVNEYRRAKDYQIAIRANQQPLQEWLSRDIADWMVGGWIAFGVQVLIVLWLVWTYLL